jgi:hypothetical protein
MQDGLRVNTHGRQQLHRISDDEMDRLVQIIREESGDKLTRPEFTDAMLHLFEDIAGFETLPISKRTKYVKLLWLRYQGACLGK